MGVIGCTQLREIENKRDLQRSGQSSGNPAIMNVNEWRLVHKSFSFAKCHGNNRS